jgi:hypothetical protein
MNDESSRPEGAAPDEVVGDVAEGWPAEPGNEALARFAASLRAGRPRLPPEAIGRVADAMFREMERDTRPPAGRGFLTTHRRLALAAAASVALAGGAWLVVALSDHGPAGPHGGGPLAEKRDAGDGHQGPGAASRPIRPETPPVHMVNDPEFIPDAK